MPQVDRIRTGPFSSAGLSRPAHRQLRRPTRLPRVIATRAIDRYIQRLLWLFGGA